MKKLVSILMVISLVLTVFSCSKKPNDLPVSQEASATKSISIIAAEGNTTTTDVIFNLSDFAALSKYEKWVESGLVQTTSVMTVSGITEGQNVELTNIKLSLASNSKVNLTLPNVTDNVTFKELPQLNFLQQVINEVIKKGSSKVYLSYKTTNDITSPVKFSIKIDGKFSF